MFERNGRLSECAEMIMNESKYAYILCSNNLFENEIMLAKSYYGSPQRLESIKQTCFSEWSP
jgi:hypothetical protein